MKKSGHVIVLATFLSACAGLSAGGQTPPADPGSLGRLHVYEISDDDPRLVTMQTQEPGWIEVSGTGTVDVQPDRARATFAMETRATAADAAAGANADAMAAVLAAVRSAGLPGLEVETFGYSVRPEYAISSDQRTREIVAYTVLNNVGATITDVDAVGRLVDAAIGAGANRVGGIYFVASETEAARRQALARAVRVASAEAEVMAEALGHRLGPPLQVNGGADRPTPMVYQAEMAMMARAADTPIEAGDQTVTARVTIRFALGPELGG